MNYRALGVGAIVLCIVSICAVILVVVARGGVATNVSSIASLVVILGVLATSLVTVLSVRDVQTKMNGHLSKHEESVQAAQTAAATAASVADQLAEARSILEEIRHDTNSNLTAARDEVAGARQEVVDLKAEMARLREALANPGTEETHV